MRNREFSNAAAGYARNVSCIDLDDGRLNPVTLDNVHFEKMDASKMRYPDGVFDAVFVYNELYHIRSQWGEIEKECRRVLKPGGSIYLIAAWKLDVAQMQAMFGGKVSRKGDCSIVRLGKMKPGEL